MFDKNSIEELARQARESLAQQQEENEPTDIYKDIREEINNEDNAVTEAEYFSIENKPTEYHKNPTVHNKSTEDEELPIISPYDKPIFPGGPLQSQIDSWKKQWEGYDLHVVEITGKFFVFRTLNRFEYKQVVSLPNTDPLMREEVICQTVTLWPQVYNWSNMATDKAGVPSTYAQVIMDKSGFTRDYAIQVL